jgi:acyl phosphate:glycerol-3-phosphate acyltransferase
MNYILAIIIGYLIGSIPTAYLLLKNKGVDITKEGSGNVGAMNSYEVTSSKSVGIIVLVVDLLKGVLAVFIVRLIFTDYFVFPALALIFAVISHNYNPWIGFKGGRGLATAAGGTILLFPFILVVWLVTYAIAWGIKKNIHFANIWATLFSLIIPLLSINAAVKYTYPRAESVDQLAFFVSFLMIIIFLKHIDPLMNLIQSKELFTRGKR